MDPDIISKEFGALVPLGIRQNLKYPCREKTNVTISGYFIIDALALIDLKQTHNVNVDLRYTEPATITLVITPPQITQPEDMKTTVAKQLKELTKSIKAPPEENGKVHIKQLQKPSPNKKTRSGLYLKHNTSPHSSPTPQK